MDFRNRILKKWKRSFEKDLYHSAYEQGKFDEWADNNIKEIKR